MASEPQGSRSDHFMPDWRLCLLPQCPQDSIRMKSVRHSWSGHWPKFSPSHPYVYLPSWLCSELQRLQQQPSFFFFLPMSLTTIPKVNLKWYHVVPILLAKMSLSCPTPAACYYFPLLPAFSSGPQSLTSVPGDVCALFTSVAGFLGTGDELFHKGTPCLAEPCASCLMLCGHLKPKIHIRTYMSTYTLLY